MPRGLKELRLPVLIAFLSLSLHAAQNPSTCKGPQELEQAIANQPSAGAYNALGAHFAQRNEYGCAIPAFDKALQLDAKSWETRYNLGLALLQKGDRTRAARELREVVTQRA